ncbi:DUF4269 domain-containing protein [Virgibacillus sp. C22-A2]|uniref:DUF4269 domain-containing protein n=1 Tax=Virgibacillus tibetensis TaxID=3042313 RepID=A0ABU6KKI1_9BACI|nr:DUF4269 domain-containing protein [Virgibacillus sp. C22-A2]
MLDSFETLKNGNAKQIKAYKAIYNLNIMSDLKEFTPVLCGTIPIAIDLASSDLDIIMEVHDFEQFELQITHLYKSKDVFRIKRTVIRSRLVVKANFLYEGFQFELFGQAQPIHKQHAYLHMIIEQALIKANPGLREKVIRLKKQGYKTEPAFCKILGISGDSYENLIIYGKEVGIDCW